MPELHQKKIMITVWWSQVELIHYDCLNPGKTITANQRNLHQKLQRLHPALINRKDPILLQDKAIPLVATATLQRLNKQGYEILSHHHIHGISRQTITIFSITSTTSWIKNVFLQTMLQKTPFWNLWNPESQSFKKSGQKSLYQNGKRLLMITGFILINKNISQWSYIIFKLTQ